MARACEAEETNTKMRHFRSVSTHEKMMHRNKTSLVFRDEPGFYRRVMGALTGGAIQGFFSMEKTVFWCWGKLVINRVSRYELVVIKSCPATN
jgi:hypothetical protein